MKEKIKQFFDKISERVSKHPTYVAFIRKRDVLADFIRVAVLALFNAIGPLWTFLFVKNSDSENKHGATTS